MVDEGIAPWCANPYHPAFKAARQATAWAYEDVPNMIREGGSLDCVVSLQVRIFLRWNPRKKRSI